ncbi:sensor histidine kinase [Salibacterium qingdaonense]|uniref:histidine kinase n=1 Tax=Salibacterium qingdaonense TaxID=266892 RepID=A0A1I4PWP6_9BACI|nr:sensor histidine kinase [Salibacterium qingdaonense]SFM32154.1 two-component system, NarL family, sensor histidine kinase DesK [Salibacterium qingdaonense]
MQNWFHIFPKNTGLSLYAWIIFCLLPFYFVITSSGLFEVFIGILLIALFFTTYRLSFIKKGWTVYVSVGIEIMISIGMTMYFGYVYFALFLAFFIGNIRNKAGFITLYVVHIVTANAAITAGFFMQREAFMMQLPFIVISVIGIILLPVNIHNRNKREELESELEDANERISQLMIVEERQRIARDLHDTLGQKLSLIGFKSDLSQKLMDVNPEDAKKEIGDIHQTARAALKEVREIVSDMKGTKLKDEIHHVQEILKASQITFHLEGDPPEVMNLPVLSENVLSMCLKESVTNVVKHSQADTCYISFLQEPFEVVMTVRDNGAGMPVLDEDSLEESGLQGMKERLEFVNGSLHYESNHGLILTVRVPFVIQPPKQGESL